MTVDLFSKSILLELRHTTETSFGKAKGKRIYNDACRYLASYLKTADYRNNPAIKYHMKSNILPGLAYYQSLLHNQIPKKQALAYVSAELEKYSEKQRVRMSKISKLPFIFPIFRLAAGIILPLEYPSAGWDTTWINNNRQEVSFNMTRCLYCDELKKYNSLDLARLFCQSDVTTYQGLEPAILFKRNGTLADGAKCCDFRYVNNKSNIAME